MAEWSRVVNTVTNEFYRTEEVNVLRRRILTDELRKRGRITFGHSGQQMDWKIRYKQIAMTGYADMDTLTFSRKDEWKTAQLPWRGYAITDAVSKKERLMNRGTEAIIKYYDTTAKRLMQDMGSQFGEQFFVDGNAAGYTKGIHGVESFLGNSGAIGSGGYVGSPNSTYGGLVCTLGNYGGSWTPPTGKQWPEGAGDATQTYDFWAPVIVDYTVATWASSTKTWPNTCLEALRFGIMESQRNKNRIGQMDWILMGSDLYRPVKDKLATEERIIVERGTEQSSEIAVGYNDRIKYDGANITWEYGVPGAVAYGFNFEEMELASLQDQLFSAVGPAFDEATLTYRFACDFFGNLRCNPRAMAKWMKIT